MAWVYAGVLRKSHASADVGAIYETPRRLATDLVATGVTVPLNGWQIHLPCLQQDPIDLGGGARPRLC